MTESSHDLAGPLFERVPLASRAALVRTLGSAQPDPEGPPRAFFGKPSWKVPVGWGDPVTPWEAEFVLKDIIGCDDFGPTEKLAWEYALRFEGVALTLAFQKFGLRAYVDRDALDEEEAAAVASRLMLALGKAMPVLRKTVLSQVADEQIARGEVNIDNHFPRLRAQYEHFRELSAASSAAAEVAVPIREEHPGPPASISFRNPAYELRRNAEFETNAAMNAFFSMLEHLLLIEYLLSGGKADEGGLAAFIAGGWNGKFKQVVDLSDRASKIQYDELVAVHDQVRNRSIHGEIHSDGTDFSFILPGVGPVPARLMISAGSRSYRWADTKSAAVLGVLERAADWITTGPLGTAVRYGESGLPLFFGPGLRDEIVATRDDPAAFAETIHNIGRMLDDAANMDW